MVKNKFFLKFFIIITFLILFVSFVSAKESGYYFSDRIKGTFCFSDSCLLETINKAQEKQEPKLCYSLVGNWREEECLQEVSSEITIPEKCEGIREADYKNSCYISVAKFTKDINYCYKIIGEEEKRYPCFDAVAVATSNEALCEDYSCLTSIAISKQNPEICRSKKELRGYEIYARDYMENYPEAFFEIRSPIDMCLERYAVSSWDEQVCFTLSDNDNKNSCFREVAIGNNDITICKYIQNVYPEEVKLCSLVNGKEIHVINGAKVCEDQEAILDDTDLWKVDNCHLLIVTELNDTSQCGKTRNDSVKIMNKCYFEVSLVKDDDSICENIEISGDSDVTCNDYIYSIYGEDYIIPPKWE